MAILASQTTPTTCGDALFALKALLVSAGWTVGSSGTGSAGAGSGVYNGSGDAITTAALMKNQGAWFRIVSPLGASGPQYIFQNNQSGVGTDNGQINVWVTCYGIAGAGTASVPNAFTSGAQIRAASSLSTFGSNGTYRFWCAADNAAPYGFWFGAIPIGGGAMAGVNVLAPLSAFNVGDPTPYVFLTNPSNTAATWQTVSVPGNTLTTAGVYAYLPLTTTLTGTIGFLPVNQAFQGGALTLAATSSGGGYGVDPITGKDALFPIMFARSLSITLPSWKGVTTFARWKGTVRTNGDTATLNSPRDLIHTGDLVLPWDGSVPIL